MPADVKSGSMPAYLYTSAAPASSTMAAHVDARRSGCLRQLIHAGETGGFAEKAGRGMSAIVTVELGRLERRQIWLFHKDLEPADKDCVVVSQSGAVSAHQNAVECLDQKGLSCLRASSTPVTRSPVTTPLILPITVSTKRIAPIPEFADVYGRQLGHREL